MANLQQVGFTSPYSAEESAIERRKKLAEALQAQSMQPMETQTAGGWAIPNSPLQGAAKLAQAFASRKTAESAEQKQRELGENYRRDTGLDMQRLIQALQGRQAQPSSLQEDASGNAWMSDPIASQSPMQGLQQALPGMQTPMGQQMASSALMQQMKPQEGYTLGPGAQRFGPDNKPIASTPFKPDAPDEFSRMLLSAGIDPKSEEARRIANERLKKMTTHPDPTSVKVDVKTAEGLAKEIGPMVAESRNAALGAVETVETVGRVKQALESGNINIGPTATLRNARDQFAQVLGVSGKTTEERLVNTRNVIRGLAQFTVAARNALKGQGQVSDYEGKLLTKAESGEIDDFTAPELKAFIDVTDRMARLRYQQHARNVDVMKKRPDLSNLVPFYEVPEMPAGQGPLPGGLNPKTIELLDKYAPLKR